MSAPGYVICVTGSFHEKILAHGPHLPRVVEEHQPHWTGNGDQVLDVEEQALVAADDESVTGSRGPTDPEVESAHAVLAAEEQPLEDGQRDGAAVRA